MREGTDRVAEFYRDGALADPSTLRIGITAFLHTDQYDKAISLIEQTQQLGGRKTYKLLIMPLEVGTG
jgi:hypothetical protein